MLMLFTLLSCRLVLSMDCVIWLFGIYWFIWFCNFVWSVMPIKATSFDYLVYFSLMLIDQKFDLCWIPNPSFLIAKEAFEVCFPFLWVFLYYNSFLLLFCLWVKTDFCYFFLGFVDIQSAISKINPELLKSVIASGFAANKTTPENGNQFSNKSFDLCWIFW